MSPGMEGMAATTSAASAVPRTRPSGAGRVRRALRRIPRAAWACALVALVNGLAWSLIVPPFQVPDENAHYAYVQQIAERGTLPRIVLPEGPLSPREDQMLNSLITFGVAGHPENAAPDTDVQQQVIEGISRKNLSALGSGDALSATNNPPLYYVLQAVPYKPRVERQRARQTAGDARPLGADGRGDRSARVHVRARAAPWDTLGMAGRCAARGLPAAVRIHVRWGEQRRSALSHRHRGPVGAGAGFSSRAYAGNGALIGGFLGAGLVSKLNLIGFVPAVALAVALLVRRGWTRDRRLALPRRCVGDRPGGSPDRAVRAPEPSRVGPQRDTGRSRSVRTPRQRFATSASGKRSATSGSCSCRRLWMRPQFSYSPIWETWFKGFIGRFGWLDYGFPEWVYQVARDRLPRRAGARARRARAPPAGRTRPPRRAVRLRACGRRPVRGDRRTVLPLSDAQRRRVRAGALPAAAGRPVRGDRGAGDQGRRASVGTSTRGGARACWRSATTCTPRRSRSLATTHERGHGRDSGAQRRARVEARARSALAPDGRARADRLRLGLQRRLAGVRARARRAADRDPARRLQPRRYAQPADERGTRGACRAAHPGCRARRRALAGAACSKDSRSRRMWASSTGPTAARPRPRRPCGSNWSAGFARSPPTGSPRWIVSPARARRRIRRGGAVRRRADRRARLLHRRERMRLARGLAAGARFARSPTRRTACWRSTCCAPATPRPTSPTRRCCTPTTTAALEELRRCFDEWRGLLEVYGWREPASPMQLHPPAARRAGRARRAPMLEAREPRAERRATLARGRPSPCGAPRGRAARLAGRSAPARGPTRALARAPGELRAGSISTRPAALHETRHQRQ